MRVLLFVFFLTASMGWTQTREVVALARSEAPFLAGGAEAPGEGNVFEGETLASYYLPARIDYLDGSRYVLGIGSTARLGASAIELEGVSLEIVEAGSRRRPIGAGLWVFRPSEDCKATIYMDRADAATLHVERGSVEVRSRMGASIETAGAGDAKTYASVDGELSVQENRGPLEMARILLRELNYAYVLERAVPRFGNKRQELTSRLVDSTDGVLLLDGDVRGMSLISGGAADIPMIDPDRVRSAAAEVSYEIHRSAGWSRYGCGKPACASLAGAVAGDPFGGDARLVEPQPVGCLLCRPVVEETFE